MIDSQLSSKNTVTDIFASLLCVLIVFVINFFVPSQINGFPQNGFNVNLHNLIRNETAETVFESRYSSPVFRRRPFVLETQKLLNERAGIPFQSSFNLINSLFLFLFFFTVSKRTGLDTRPNSSDRNFLRIVFLFSMPIIFCFFASIGTYDDFVQYVFLLLFLDSLFKGNQVKSMILFTLACISRETSFIYYLIVFSFLIIEVREKRGKKLFMWVLPILIYLIYLKFYMPMGLVTEAKEFFWEKRFHAWKDNFHTWAITRETITLLAIMNLPYVHILFHKHSKARNLRERRWCRVLILFILINSIIMTLTGLVREVRLLFIPLLMVIPFIHSEIRSLFDTLIKYKCVSAFTAFKAMLISTIIAFVWYTPIAVGAGYFFKAYIFIFSFISFLLLFSKAANQKH